MHKISVWVLLFIMWILGFLKELFFIFLRRVIITINQDNKKIAVYAYPTQYEITINKQTPIVKEWNKIMIHNNNTVFTIEGLLSPSKFCKYLTTKEFVEW